MVHQQWRKDNMVVQWTVDEQRRDAQRSKGQGITVASPPLSLQRERRFPRAEVTPKACGAAADATVRSRSPRVSSRVRSVSPRNSSMLAPPARARRFIDDEAAATDADDDEAGGENLDEFERDGFVVSDHESEPAEPEAADADEVVEDDDEQEGDASLRTPLGGAAPRARSASRTEVVESEPRSQLFARGQAAAEQEVTQEVTQEVAQEVAQEVQQEEWPPC